MREGLLFIVSAPSGTGKTTLVERLVCETDNLTMSRSYTSRPPRGDEADGVDYNFVSRAEFERKIAADDFLEWADVFGNLYGTGRADLAAALETGRDVVLVIDVQGARQVRKGRFPHVAVFVLPPSYQVLGERLRGRSHDANAVIARRLEIARQEVLQVSEYDYVVVNDEFEACVGRLRSIVVAERARLRAMRARAEQIVRTFE